MSGDVPDKAKVVALPPLIMAGSSEVQVSGTPPLHVQPSSETPFRPAGSARACAFASSSLLSRLIVARYWAKSS